MAKIVNPPPVLSISYVRAEFSNDDGTRSAFNQQAIKFGAMGITVFASSGDDGATYGSGTCAYAPNFPSVNPYVTPVGGTSVIESKLLL